MPPSLADWQLPPGVTRGLWDYLHDPGIADGYDAGVAGSALVAVDLEYARRFFAVPGRLIDLGCGTGRLLLDFARRGYAVLGVDLSEEMLRVASRKAAEVGLCVSLLKANLVALDALADGSFDYAACLFSTLGMISGAAERRRFIHHVHRLLRPGGKFLLHVHNRWFRVWDRSGRKWLAASLARALLRRPAADCPMPVHRGIAGLMLHHFTRREAVGLLKSAGFRVVAIHPLGLRSDGQLPIPGWFGWLRAYGYLLAAEKA